GLRGLWRGEADCEGRWLAAAAQAHPQRADEFDEVGRLWPRLRLRPRRRGGVLRPGLLPRGTRPTTVLRPARARLRARNQEAPRILGEAQKRKDWGLMLYRCVVAVCAMSAIASSPARAVEAFVGRWAVKPEVCNAFS